MERRSRSWALGLSFIGFFTLLLSLGFVQQAKADDVAEYGTVIGIVSGLCIFPRNTNACRANAHLLQDLGTTYS